MQYYGTRLSENLSRREPEGYLLCLNVPVARSGTQEYLPSELGLSPGPGLVSVRRPEEEVFSPEAIASFEGMPVTNDHPPEGVDVSNIRVLQKGHAHNVRRGSGAESDLLLADLIITDAALITAVLEGGKREISCGYTYELCEEDGQYIQRKIRGNHVAVVDAGRAGNRVSIRDRKPTNERRSCVMRSCVTKKSLSRVLARMAKDGDAETVAEIIEEMIHPEEAAPEGGTEGGSAAAGSAVGTAAAAEEPRPEAPQSEKPEETEEKNIIIDREGLAGLLERLDRILALLETPVTDSGLSAADPVGEALEQAAEEAEDPMTAEVAAAMEEILDPVASVILEQAEGPEGGSGLPETLPAGDALRAALGAVRPVLARMPRGMRKKMAGDIAARLRQAGGRRTGSDVYAALASAQRRTEPVSGDLGRRIMEKRNVSYKEGSSRG